MDIFYTTREVAKILKVNHRTIAKLIYKGKIRAVNVGSDKKPMWRIYDGEIKRFMAYSYEKYSDPCPNTND